MLKILGIILGVVAVEVAHADDFFSIPYDGRHEGGVIFEDGEFRLETYNQSDTYVIREKASYRTTVFPEMFPWYDSHSKWQHADGEPVNEWDRLGKTSAILKGAPYRRGSYMTMVDDMCGHALDHTSPNNELTPHCPGKVFEDRVRADDEEEAETSTSSSGGGHSIGYSHSFEATEKFNMGPSFFFQRLNISKVIGTDIYSEDLTESEGAHTPVIKYDRDQGGYQKIDTYSYGIGLGVTGGWNSIGNSGLGEHLAVFAGLTPSKSESILSSQVASSREEAKSLPRLKLPYKASDIDEWSNGDSITYGSSGGLLFSSGIGTNFVSLGFAYSAVGSWYTFVRKLDDKTVLVSLSKGKLKHVSKSINLGYVLNFATASVEEFNSVNESFTYLMKLSNEKTRHAYEDLLKGNMIPTQELVKDGVVTTVVPIMDGKGIQHGRLKAFRIGIPFIVVSRSEKGNIFTFNRNVYHPYNTVSDVHHGTYTRNSRTDIFNQLKTKNFVFNATAFDTTAEGGTVTESSHSAQLTWFFENSRMTRKRLKRLQDEITRQTGIRKEISFKVEGPKKLGYAALYLKARMSRLATDQLINIASNEETKRNFWRIARGFITSYFENGYDDPNNICEYRENESIDNCARRFERKTKKAISRLRRALVKMGENRGTDKAAFVKYFARFGKHMMENQFVFQTIFNIIKNRHGLDLEVKLIGENLPHYKRYYDWVPRLRTDF